MMAVVGTGIGRVVNEELQLGPHTIPKGTILWAPIQAIQSSPALWDQPDTFMPVRVFSFCCLTSNLPGEALLAGRDVHADPTRMKRDSTLAAVTSRGYMPCQMKGGYSSCRDVTKGFLVRLQGCCHCMVLACVQAGAVDGGGC